MSVSTNKTSSIFITGNSRSGTTMMAKILGKNPLIFMFYELHFFEQLWYPGEDIEELTKEEAINLFCKLISIQREGYLSDRNPGKFYDEVSSYFSTLKEKKLTAPSVFMDFLIYESKLHNKKIPCEQTPRNLFFAKNISELYEGSKIICMVRDPRDVLLSQKFKWKRRLYGHADLPMKEMVRAWFNYHPITISKLWNASAKQILNLSKHENVYVIKFEQLINDPQILLRQLCDFLNINFDESMLKIPNEGSSIINDEIGQIGIDKTKSGNFLKGGLTKTEVYLCQKITADYRNKFGYETVKINVNGFSVLLNYISFPIKLFFALLLNLGRSKNLVKTIRSRFSI